MLIPIIHELFSKYSSSLRTDTHASRSNQFLVDLIHLIYLTNSQGKRRVTSKEMLYDALGIDINKFTPSPDSSLFNFIENNSIPSELFLIGFYLGDGSISCSFIHEYPKNKWISVKLSFSLEQSYSTSNEHLINLFSRIFPEVSNVFFSNSVARYSIIGDDALFFNLSSFKKTL